MEQNIPGTSEKDKFKVRQDLIGLLASELSYQYTERRFSLLNYRFTFKEIVEHKIKDGTIEIVKRQF